MRFIDITGLRTSHQWDLRAARALQAAAAASDDQRASVIDANRDVWADLKPILEQLSHKKCWYCEAKQIRSDKQVDHFRPKNRVEGLECADNHGYWWLAFDWHNFRYCCTYCNSRRKDLVTGTTGGKAARFPLLDESKRATIPGQSIQHEQPVLLDPTEPGDPGMLWFDEDGMACPKYSADSFPWFHTRAKESIQLYHLDHTDLKEARQAVCNECKQMAEQADAAWRDYGQESPVAARRFKDILEQLAKRLSSTAEYSGAARATMMGLRGEDRPWIDELLSMG